MNISLIYKVKVLKRCVSKLDNAYHDINPFRVFHISDSWWSFIGVWVAVRSLQVFRTLLSILADLSNAVILIVSVRPPISSSSSPFTKSLGNAPSTPITICITVTLHVPSDFLVLWQGLSICRFLFFSLCNQPERQSLLFDWFSFLSFFLSSFFFFFFLRSYLPTPPLG